MASELSGRVALITGAAHGQGRASALALAREGVRIAALDVARPQQIAERSAGNLLPMPWIEPEDVAAAVVYLASERARFITGSQFVLDAGLLTR